MHLHPNRMRNRIRFRTAIMEPFSSKQILIICLIKGILLLTGVTTAQQVSPKDSIDVQEGDNVKLRCRFSPQIWDKDSTLFWIRTNRQGHDNAAIGSTPFHENYNVDFRPQEGIYDLTLTSATYDRDNGNFECRMKAAGTGHELHSKSVELTVLLKPSTPTLSPTNPTATEGRLLNFTCSSIGGSPPPKIQWFREGDNRIMDSQYIPGRNKDEPTKAVLSINPTKRDDESSYRCTVWNRAMGQRKQYEATTKIFVNYFPRVTIGPENPLKVELDEPAQLECLVDSKPSVTEVKWHRGGRFIDTHFKHTIPRVSLKEAGTYVCSADNGLGQTGKAELNLDVLHAPIVKLPASREVKENEDVTIECNVEANPRPASIQWYKEGDEKFLQNGQNLRIRGVKAKDNGRYVCVATNYLQPTGKGKTMRTGNSTIDINVRHRPGKGFINPEKPIGVDGQSVTLTCGANPPGFPKPTYRWWKQGSASKSLAVGSEFTINSVRLDSAGKYFCQPNNELGTGVTASVNLEVYQAPKIITQLQPNIMKRAGDTGFHISCSAMGKPKPLVKWFKDGEEIQDAESKMYQITTSEQEALPNMGYNVLSTLKYIGPERIGSNSNQLMSTDRGHYTCQFENEVSKAVTEMMLRIEHSPVVVHHHNRVAFDLHETAYIDCLMQAYPAPQIEWSFGNSILQGDRHNYETNLTDIGDDVFKGVLKINRVTESSYGNYICKGSNKLGDKRTIIKLQPKGKPSKPTNLRPIYVSFDVITMAWDEGFNGGYNNTMFTIQYNKEGESTPRYQDCSLHNPCNITGLDQHTKYNIKVKASNIRGETKFSKEIRVLTKVDVALIPMADNVHYARIDKAASFNVLNDLLPLVAKVEVENDDGTWRHYDEFALGSSSVGLIDIKEEKVNNLRVRLCLETNNVLCGPYANAKLVDASPVLPRNSGTAPWLIGVICVVIVVLIMICIVVVKCCCCKGNKKSNVKTRPDIIHSTQPPPYPSNYGIENKGVDTVKDTDETIKNNLYAAQNGYEYNNTHPYPEQSNSNSNSANGGSVNSQDSLWNVKGAPGVIDAHFQNGYNPNEYPYDPTIQQQQQLMYEQQQQQHAYMAQEDYAHYPNPDEYLNERNQQYLMGEQYGMANDGRHMNMQMDGDYAPYGDVSGLPNPYINQSSDPQQMLQQQQLQHPQHSTANVQEGSPDDSDFSPRRVIREIIV